MKKIISFRNAILLSYFVFVTILIAISANVSFLINKDEELRQIESEIRKIQEVNLLIYKAEHDFLNNELINPDFYKSRKSSYLIELTKQVSLYNQKTSELRKRSHIEKFDSLLAYSNLLINKRHNDFLKLANLQLKRGFKDYGVEGEMRKSIHLLETKYPQLSKVSVLSIRRAEKDYILRKDSYYVAALQKMVTDLKSNINQSSLNNKAQAILLCNQYLDNFMLLANTEKQIGFDNLHGLKGTLHSDFQKLDATLKKFADYSYLELDKQKSDFSIYLPWLLVTAIFLSIILALILSKYVTQPVEKLTFLMTDAAKNKYLIQKRHKTGSNFLEVRLLENKFYEMMNDINKKIVEINDSNSKLEQKNEELEAINDLLSDTNSKLRKSENTLKKSISVKEKLLGIISHDVRSPLTTLKGYLNILTIAPDILPEEKRLKTIENIKNAVDLQLDLLSNMVEWARSQMGDITFHPEILSLKQVALNSIKLLNPMASTKNIILKIDMSDSAIMADKNMLELIFRNLISNAIKFSYPNSVIRIFSEKQDAHTIKVSIRDSGIGMSQKNIKEILKNEAFLSQPGTQNEKGTGFGLQFSKEFVYRNGGELIIESEEGKGTLVSFTVKRILQRKIDFLSIKNILSFQ